MLSRIDKFFQVENEKPNTTVAESVKESEKEKERKRKREKTTAEQEKTEKTIKRFS